MLTRAGARADRRGRGTSRFSEVFEDVKCGSLCFVGRRRAICRKRLRVASVSSRGRFSFRASWQEHGFLRCHLVWIGKEHESVVVERQRMRRCLNTLDEGSRERGPSLHRKSHDSRKRSALFARLNACVHSHPFIAMTTTTTVAPKTTKTTLTKVRELLRVASRTAC